VKESLDVNVLENIYEELIGEGYSADDVEKAIEFALTEEGPRSNIGYRAGRALRNMGSDLVRGTATSLKNLVTGTPNNAKTNPASARQQQRLKNISTFAKNSSKPTPTRSRTQNRRSSSPAASANASSGTTKTPLKPIPADKRPADMQKGKVYGDPSATKTTPRPSSTPTSSPRPAPTSTPRPAAPKPAAQTKNPAADMASWAKANPSLASKVTAAGTQKGTGQSTMAKQAAELRAMRPATPTPTNTSSATTNPLMKGFKSKMSEGIYQPEGETIDEGERAGIGGNRGLAAGSVNTRSRGGETSTIQNKQSVQRDAANAAGARGPEMTHAAKMNNLKRSMPTNMRNSYEPEGVTFSEAELKAIQAKVDAWDVENEITEFVAAPAGSPIDRHSRGISKYDKRPERQIRMDNFAAKRTKMLNQPKTP